MRRHTIPLFAATFLIAAGCGPDVEVFEEGGTLEAPPEVQEAPIMPIPPQPMPPRGTPSDTVLPPVDPDTITAEDIRPPA